MSLLGRWYHAVPLWIRSLLDRDPLEREPNEELSFHLEQRIAENLQSGMSFEEASRKARLQLGGMEALKEHCREQRALHAKYSTGSNSGRSVSSRRRSSSWRYDRCNTSAPHSNRWLDR